MTNENMETPASPKPVAPDTDLRQWAVYRVNQRLSRNNPPDPNHPPQPLDDLRDYRRYVIITPTAQLKNAFKINCVPIGTKSFNPYVHIPLALGEAGCSKDCYIWANEIFTLERPLFDLEYGELPVSKIQLLRMSLKNWLGL